MRDSYTGQRALRVEPGETERSWNSVKLPVKAGEQYELAGFIRSTSTDARALIRVTWYDSSGREIGHDETASVGKSDWKRAEPWRGEPVEAPPDATHAIVSCVVTPGTDGGVWFDEIVLAAPITP